MDIQTADALTLKKCVHCEAGVPTYTPDEAKAQSERLDGWQLPSDAGRIRKRWVMKNFLTAIEFFKRIAELSEAEDHHPDLHLEGYRNVTVELYTHAIGG